MRHGGGKKPRKEKIKGEYDVRHENNMMRPGRGATQFDSLFSGRYETKPKLLGPVGLLYAVQRNHGGQYIGGETGGG